MTGFDTVLNDPAACVQVLPENAHYWRAWCHYRLGQLSNALSDFQAAQASKDNGFAARYMIVLISHKLGMNDQSVMQKGVDQLNSLIANPDLPTSLKGKALLYRNLLRHQLGVDLYRRNQINISDSYFRGILGDNEKAGIEKIDDIIALLNASALSWVVHETLIQDKPVNNVLTNYLSTVQPPKTPEHENYSIYFQSILHLYSSLLLNDYEQFVMAKNSFLSLEPGQIDLRDYAATLDLLEGNYSAVIGAGIEGDAFSNFRMAWAHFLRNDQTQQDLRMAVMQFQKSRDAMPKCQSALRRASAFRYLQMKFFQDWSTNEFSEKMLEPYFAQECLLSDSTYSSQKEIWNDVFEESLGFIKPNCRTGRGYLDIGLYKSNPQLIERGKSQLFASGCNLYQDDLFRAILLCIGTAPDYNSAIDVLQGIVDGNGPNLDEAKYALAMAYYNHEESEIAIPLFNDLAKKGSLDASYKLANIYYKDGDYPKACRYLAAFRQRSSEYSIYRNDASKLYAFCDCGAIGASAIPMPDKGIFELLFPQFNVFAYDYVGQGVGIMSRFVSEMKSEIAKFITPQLDIDFFDSELLEPTPALTAYINLIVQTPLETEPTLHISIDGEEIAGAVLKKTEGGYIYKSGPQSMGEFDIAVNQKGSFGWSFKNFISRSYDKEIALNRAFDLKKRKIGDRYAGGVSHVMFDGDAKVIFSPRLFSKEGQDYRVSKEVGVINSAVFADGTLYCLSAENGKVFKVIPILPDSSFSELFIHGVYDPKNDILEYAEGLSKPLKIFYIEKMNNFFILNSNGTIFRFNSKGHCVGAILKPAPISYILDIAYDSGENCLWLLDIATKVIHKYDLLENSYGQFESKKIIDTNWPLSLLLDGNYFYLFTGDGKLYLHKKDNFRLLNVFVLDKDSEHSSFVDFSLAGDNINNRKIIALKKIVTAGKIWSEDAVDVFESKFDPGFLPEK